MFLSLCQWVEYGIGNASPRRKEFSKMLNEMGSEAKTQCCIGSHGYEKSAEDKGNQRVGYLAVNFDRHAGIHL